MSRSDLTRGGSTEAMSASWKVSEEVGVFLVAVRAGLMNVDNARAYLGIDTRQAEVLLELTSNDPLERRQVVRIIARRRLTLKAFERELAYAGAHGEISVPAGAPERAQVSSGGRAGSNRPADEASRDGSDDGRYSQHKQVVTADVAGYEDSVGSGVEGDSRGLRSEPADSRGDRDPAEAGIGLPEQAPEDGDDRDCGVVAVELPESQEIEGHTGAEGAAVKEVA